MSNSDSGKLSKKSKKQQLCNDNGETAPELSKEESQIARFLRLSCPNKQGNLMGMKVDYFIGSKLVDSLMESKWGPGTLTPPSTSKQEQKANTKQPFLANRQACVNFMQRLMNKQLFCRTVKVYKESSNESKSDSTPNLRKRKTVKAEKDSTPQPSQTPQQQQQQQKDNQQKRKFKLEMHQEQKFYDSTDPYAWVYDPTSTKTYIIGSLLILGSIGICLFPLWPSQVREGVYYLSLTGAGFLGVILGLALFKYVLFAIVWAVTLGKVRFWLLPNLTEDVGFFESFVPAYTCKVGAEEKKSEESVDVRNNVEEVEKEKEALVDEEVKETEKEATAETITNEEVKEEEEEKSVKKSDKEKEDEDFEIIDDED